MNMQLKPLRAAFSAWGLVVLLAACNDAGLVAPSYVPVVRASIRCTAWVGEAVVRCGDAAPPPGVQHTLVMGGQDTLVRVVATGTWHDPAAQRLYTTVSIANLLSQPMGTTDGVTSKGLRVFFQSAPSATVGKGAVRVANADGRDRFTAPEQAYFAYPQVLQPGESSAPKPWVFEFASGVEMFTFQLLVEAQLPYEQGILRWTPHWALPRWCTATCNETTLTSAWGPGGGTVYMTGWFQAAKLGANPHDWWIPGIVARSADGGDSWGVHRSDYAEQWSPSLFRGSRHLNDVWGPDSLTLYAVGSQEKPVTRARTAVIVRAMRGWGGGFEVLTLPDDYDADLRAVWGSAANDIYAVGERISRDTANPDRRGLLLRSGDGGASWTRTELGTSLTSVWGSAANDVYVLDGRDILHSTDGGATWSRQTASGELSRVWGLDAEHVWAVGSRPPDGLILLSRDRGASWTETVVPGAAMTGIWAASPSDVFSVGSGGTVLFFNGRKWVPLPGVDPSLDLVDVWGTAANDVLVFASEGTVLRGYR